LAQSAGPADTDRWMTPSGVNQRISIDPLTIAAPALVGGIFLFAPGPPARLAGRCVDDAWYVLFAQALAAGQGYSLVNAPVPGILPPNPPGFAAILSTVFVFAPNFPANALALKAISIAAMMTLARVGYRYFIAFRDLRQPLR